MGSNESPSGAVKGQLNPHFTHQHHHALWRKPQKYGTAWGGRESRWKTLRVHETVALLHAMQASSSASVSASAFARSSSASASASASASDSASGLSSTSSASVVSLNVSSPAPAAEILDEEPPIMAEELFLAASDDDGHTSPPRRTKVRRRRRRSAQEDDSNNDNDSKSESDGESGDGSARSDGEDSDGKSSGSEGDDDSPNNTSADGSSFGFDTGAPDLALWNLFALQRYTGKLVRVRFRVVLVAERDVLWLASGDSLAPLVRHCWLYLRFQLPQEAEKALHLPWKELVSTTSTAPGGKHQRQRHAPTEPAAAKPSESPASAVSIERAEFISWITHHITRLWKTPNLGAPARPMVLARRATGATPAAATAATAAATTGSSGLENAPVSGPRLSSSVNIPVHYEQQRTKTEESSVDAPASPAALTAATQLPRKKNSADAVARKLKANRTRRKLAHKKGTRPHLQVGEFDGGGGGKLISAIDKLTDKQVGSAFALALSTLPYEDWQAEQMLEMPVENKRYFLAQHEASSSPKTSEADPRSLSSQRDGDAAHGLGGIYWSGKERGVSANMSQLKRELRALFSPYATREQKTVRYYILATCAILVYSLLVRWCSFDLFLVVVSATVGLACYGIRERRQVVQALARRKAASIKRKQKHRFSTWFHGKSAATGVDSEEEDDPIPE